MGLKGGRSLKMPGVKDEKKTGRELRADSDHILFENKYPEENTINTDGVCRGEVDGWKGSTCGRCHASCNSRNELFNHINGEWHVVGSDGEEGNFEPPNEMDFPKRWNRSANNNMETAKYENLV